MLKEKGERSMDDAAISVLSFSLIARVGTGAVYANAFHVDITNPYNMGSLHCPEASATFRILKASKDS